jgi:hypothetical protein
VPLECDTGVVECAGSKRNRVGVQELPTTLRRACGARNHRNSSTIEQATVQPSSRQQHPFRINATDKWHLTTGISQRTRAVVSAVVPALEHGDNLVEEDGALLWSTAVNLDLQYATQLNVTFNKYLSECILLAGNSPLAAVWSWCSGLRSAANSMGAAFNNRMVT